MTLNCQKIEVDGKYYIQTLRRDIKEVRRVNIKVYSLQSMKQFKQIIQEGGLLSRQIFKVPSS